MAGDGGHFRGVHRAVEAVGAKHQNIPGKYLMLVDVHVDR